MLARLAALLALAVALAGCLSPTLPLPPPEPSFIEASATEGMWLIRGESNEGHAIVLLHNERTGAGVSTVSDAKTRAYAVEIAALPCDAITLLELDEGENEASSTSFLIQPTQNGFDDNSCR